MALPFREPPANDPDNYDLDRLDRPELKSWQIGGESGR
jgi:hypothetical protein